jgi:hypothetical protein
MSYFYFTKKKILIQILFYNITKKTLRNLIHQRKMIGFVEISKMVTIGSNFTN